MKESWKVCICTSSGLTHVDICSSKLELLCETKMSDGEYLKMSDGESFTIKVKLQSGTRYITSVLFLFVLLS